MASRKLAIRDETNIRLRCSKNVEKHLFYRRKTLRVSTQHVSVCTFKTSPCAPAPRPHVETCVRVVPVHNTPQPTTSSRPQHHTETETEKEDRERRQRQKEKRRRREVLFLVNPVCARDLCLLNSVKYDSSLISFSASWQVNSFLTCANYLFYGVTVFQFIFELFTYAVTVSKVFRIILFCSCSFCFRG